MIKPSVKVKVPKIVIKTPEDPRFWKATGLELVKDIDKRTLAGKDADNRAFKPYSKAYAKARAKGTAQKNVGPRPVGKVNLSMSSRMLGSMARGVRPSRHGVKLQITGEEGFKASNIKFKQKRNFFAFNEKQVKRVIKLIKKWMKRKNK